MAGLAQHSAGIDLAVRRALPNIGSVTVVPSYINSKEHPCQAGNKRMKPAGHSREGDRLQYRKYGLPAAEYPGLPQQRSSLRAFPGGTFTPGHGKSCEQTNGPALRVQLCCLVPASPKRGYRYKGPTRLGVRMTQGGRGVEAASSPRFQENRFPSVSGPQDLPSKS